MITPADEQISEHGNRLRTAVAVLVALEAALLVAAAVFLVAALTTGHDSAGELLSLAAIAVVVAAALALCARGVLAGLPWTRGPVVTWQLLQAGVGMPLSTSIWWAGGPLLAVAVFVGVLMFNRNVITQDGERF